MTAAIGADVGWGGRSATQVLCGDDAVLEHIGYIGLGREQAEGGRVALPEGRLNSGDAQVFVAPGKPHADGSAAEFCIDRDGTVAVENEKVVWYVASCIHLAVRESGACNGTPDQQEKTESRSRVKKIRWTKTSAQRRLDEDGHVHTSSCAEICIGEIKAHMRRRTAECATTTESARGRGARDP